jgi:uncharacterized ferritin-like protein (DUF455 family)
VTTESLAEQGRPPLDPGLFAANPARDARFVVRDRWIECAHFPAEDPRRTVEFLHRQMNEEINGLEASAQSLCDFPDTPWEIRMSLARQCSDEARHAAMFRCLLEQRGGRVGQYPVLNFQYRIVARIGTLAGRLNVQNRSFEAGGLDAIDHGIEHARETGDIGLAEFFETQLADEIQHVRFANEAVRTLASRDPRTVLHMGAALTAAAEAFAAVMGREGVEGARTPVAADARSEAGFTPREIQMAGELASAMGAGTARRPEPPRDPRSSPREHA